MKFIILGNDIFPLEQLQWCNHSSECLYFHFGHKKYLFGDSTGVIYENVIIFLKNDDLVIDIPQLILLQKEKDDNETDNTQEERHVPAEP